jgi:uncharacterized protein (TIGR02145 family)
VIYLGQSHKVIVTAHNTVVGSITTAVDAAGILHLSVDDNAQTGGKGPINIDVYMPIINIIELGGKGNIRVIAGNANSLQKIMNGNVNHLYVAHSGVGDIDARASVAEAVVVKHSGRGSVAVSATDVLNVDIGTQNGEILYTGNPEIRVPVNNIGGTIPAYDAAFSEHLWAASNSDDVRIKQDPNPPVTPHGRFEDPRDGRTYVTVKIGNLTWMAENLNYTISNSETDSSWCFGDSPENCAKYGRLYNWDAAVTGCDGLGSGWRLPAQDDWDNLTSAAGGNETAGRKLKSQTGWEYYDGIVSTNELSFSALPGGYRDNNGSFSSGSGRDGLWWSSGEHEDENRVAYSRYMMYNNDNVSVSYSIKTYGFSVRCVRN